MTSWRDSCAGFKSIRNNVKPCGISKLHFIKSEWEDWSASHVSSWQLITWRCAYLLFCAGSIIQSMIDPKVGFDYWFIFVTHWSLLAQFIYCLTSILNAIIFCVQHKKRGRQVGTAEGNGVHYHGDDSNWMDSCIWILFNIVGVSPYIVTIGYWTSVHDPKNPKHVVHVTIFNHGINAVFSFIDTLIVAIPVHVTHVVYLVLFCVIYAIFTLVYEILGLSYPQTNQVVEIAYIYPFLNWRQAPGYAAASIGFTVISVSIFFSVLWLLYRLRLWLVSKLTKMHATVYERHRLTRVHPETFVNETKRDVSSKEQQQQQLVLLNEQQQPQLGSTSENVDITTADLAPTAAAEELEK